jgi:hypothetical protein
MIKELFASAFAAALLLSPAVARNPVPAPQASANKTTALELWSIWVDLNAMCRGNSGDLQSTQKACKVRLKVEHLIAETGYCMGTGINGDLENMEKHDCHVKYNRLNGTPIWDDQP